MNTTHTPGPWHAGHRQDSQTPCRIYAEADKFNEGSLIADAAGAMPLEIALENARLIAAAPELLGMLEHLVVCIDEGLSPEGPYLKSLAEDARAVIDKAKGGQ